MRFNSGESVHLRGQSRCKKIATGWISFLSVYLVANKNHFLSKVSIFSSLPTQFIVTIYTETSKEGWITDLEGSFSSEWPFLIPRTFFMGHKNAIFSSLQEIISLHTTRLFNILCFRLCSRHCHHIQGVHESLEQLHLQSDRQEQGWRQSSIRSLQGVSHSWRCSIQEPGQCDGSRTRSQQPGHLLDGKKPHQQHCKLEHSLSSNMFHLWKPNIWVISVSPPQ